MIKEKIPNGLGPPAKKRVYISRSIFGNLYTFKIYIPGFVITFDGEDVETAIFPPKPHKYYGSISISDFFKIEEV